MHIIIDVVVKCLLDICRLNISMYKLITKIINCLCLQLICRLYNNNSKKYKHKIIFNQFKK